LVSDVHPNLAKSSYGWSSLWLYHRIQKKKVHRRETLSYPLIYSGSKIPKTTREQVSTCDPRAFKVWFSWFQRKELMSLGLLLNIVNIPSLDNLGSLTPNLTFPWLIISSRRSPYSRR
jgi:hypothetical protein